MNLPGLSVRRPITWIMLSLAVALFGAFSLARLDLDMLPKIELPVVAVITTWQGADPYGVEQLVTRPIEEALETVPGVQEVTSTSSQGTSLVLAEFQWDQDMWRTEQDVRKELDLRAMDRLPDDAQRPTVFAFDPSLAPVVFLSVSAPGTPDVVRRLADDEITPRLGRIPGVAAAEVLGGADREFQVRLEPEWLAAYGISPTQVAMAVQAADAQAPGGEIRAGSVELGVVTESELENLDQISKTVVAIRDGVPIRVEDVAQVVDGLEEATYVVRTDGHPAIMLAVRKQSDANTVQVVRRVKAELAAMQSELPEGVELGVMFDQAEPITRSLSNLVSSAIQALVLTGVVLLSFLRSWRSSSIVLVSIPLSMLVTFAVMDTMDVTLNVISMAGLALAVGMLVDNSIVVIENIFVALDKGMSVRQASVEATNEVMLPIVASTLTTLAVFVPVLFVPGIAGQLFKDLALTICISLTASLGVTLTVVPLLGSLILHRLDGGRRWGPVVWVEQLAGRLTAWIEPLGNLYERVVPGLLQRPWRIIGVAVAFFVVTLAALPLIGVDFMAAADRGLIEIQVEGASGSSLEQTNATFARLEAIIHEEVPEATTINAEYGAAEGFGALAGAGSHKGTLRIALAPLAERSRKQKDIEMVLQARFAEIPGIETRVQQHAMGGTGDVVVRIALDDLATLREYGGQLAERIAGLPGVGGVNFNLADGRSEMQVRVDREQLERLGLTARDIANTLATVYMGVEVAIVETGVEEIPVKVRASPEARHDLERLRDVPIGTPAGFTVPLSAVASIEIGVGPTSVTRVNQERAGTVSVTLGQGPLGDLIAAVHEVVAEVPAPPGAKIRVEGAAEDLQESFMALGLAIIAAVILVYMVMASQFESLFEPFVILATIPLALSGAILGLLLTGTTLQVTALIGVVLLAGIVVNNGILLIDVLKGNRERGDDLVVAAGAAGRQRLRPILMTSLTTILGMVPLALEIGDGAEMWAPMARVVIGGMAVSTVLTLLVVPATYVAADRLAARWRRTGPVPNPEPVVAGSLEAR